MQIVMRRSGGDERVGETGVMGFRIGLAVVPAESRYVFIHRQNFKGLQKTLDGLSLWLVAHTGQ